MADSFPHRKQINIKDCGATCLQLISEYYGRKHNIGKLRSYSHISREGASLMGVSDAAEHIGFHTLGLCPTIEVLKQDVVLPCILFWDQQHYVVLYKIKNKRGKAKFYISDPATMKREFDEEEFSKHWHCTRRNNENRGILLTLTPTSRFFESVDDDEMSFKSGILSYLKYISPYKKQIATTTLGLVLLMLIGLIVPFLTQSLVDVGIRGGNYNYVFLILIAQLTLALTNVTIELINNRISMHVNTRINISLATDLWTKILKLPMSFFDTKVTGDIMQRLGDYGRIRNFLVNESITFTFAVVNFIIYTCILAYYNYVVLFIFLFGHMMYVLWTSMFLKFWKKQDYDNFAIASKNNNKVLQFLQGVVDIKLSNEEREKRWEWEKIQSTTFRIALKGLKIGQIENTIGTLITNITHLVISAIIANEVINGQMTLGMMMSVTYITAQIGGPINTLVGFIHRLQDTHISLERLNEIYEMKDDDTDIESKSIDWPDDNTMSFEHVNFSYDGSQRTSVLKDISLSIPEKKITALVGNSGCGKTTIIKLLQGLYTPQNGSVTIGGKPLYTINPHLLRSKTSAVMQDGYIFSDTIARNIATGSLEINRERLYEAAKIANIEDFIKSLPLGYNTKIGMEGKGVSQGQKQRILIARAIYKNPEILLFDEATNSLDSTNERIIMNNLQKYFTNKTVVIAAHRLSTIRNADQIIVMNDGKVTEQGNHEELMAKKGAYYKLIQNQL